MCRKQHRQGFASRRRRMSGFTLVELLVVMAIIVILIASVLVASTTIVTKAKVSNTRAMLAVVDSAVEQFKREQQASPTITRARQGAVRYADRYGLYPPDELEVFTSNGIPGSGSSGRSLTNGSIEPGPSSGRGYSAMEFYTKGLPWRDAILEHRDLVAMVVAIQTLGDASASILGGVQGRYWRPVPLDDQEKPAMFLDRPDADRNANGSWDSGDFEIRYIIDAWGNPISYLAQRDWNPTNPPETSSNHDLWNEASTEIIRLNGGKPVIMSYGSDGKEQLTREAMGDNALASLVGDFEAEGQHHHKVDHRLSADNIYADPTLKEKLARGIE